MALPGSLTTAFRRTETGIILGIHPSTARNFAIEVRRSTQSSTSSTTWVTEHLDPSSGFVQYRVPLPLSTRRYYFQARHTGLGYSAGNYTPIVSAMPVKFPLIVSVPILRGKNAAVEIPKGNVWLTSAQTIKVGTLATTGTITKSLRFAGHEFAAATTATKWVRSNAGLAIPQSGAGSTHSFWGVFFFPPGVTLTSCTLEGERRLATSKSFVKLVAYRQFHGFATTWFTITLAQTTGVLSFTDTGSSALSQAITSTGIVARLDIFRASGAGSSQTSNARAHAVTWKYKMPSYDKGI